MKSFADPKRPYFIGRTDTGLSFVGDIFDEYSISWAVRSDFEVRILDLLQQAMRQREGVFVDIGANGGVFALSVMQPLSGRKAILFEADPTTAMRAAATAELNKGFHVQVFAVAASNRDGEITFHRVKGQTNLGAVDSERKFAADEIDSVVVPVCRLDTAFAAGAGSPVALLKVDVEGHELSVFEGAEDILTEDMPALFFEYVSKFATQVGWSLPELQKVILASASYDFSLVNDEGHEISASTADDHFLVNVIGRPADALEALKGGKL
ncbi:MAG: hypothetical protein QOE70_5824 [Chthoniobacter sp.]|nr:hypothetical protein [Chthoniobacter sp.]